MECTGEFRLPHTHQTSKFATLGTQLHDQAVLDYLDKNNATEYATYISERAGDQYIEVPVRVITKEFVLTGTCDFFAYDGETLEVIDYKTGFTLIHPKNNKQLMGYAYGILETFKIEPTAIFLTIHQGDMPISHKLEEGELEAFKNNIAALAEHRSNPELIEGKHCQYCPSYLHCALKKENIEGILTTAPTTQTIDQKESRDLLLKEPEIKKYFDALKSVYIDEHKDHCKKSVRKTKAWKDGIVLPQGNISPVQALKLGLDCANMIDIRETIVYKVI
jgi:hypothetical protein